jgi:hypothetical protein
MSSSSSSSGDAAAMAALRALLQRRDATTGNDLDLITEIHAIVDPAPTGANDGTSGPAPAGADLAALQPGDISDTTGGIDTDAVTDSGIDPDAVTDSDAFTDTDADTLTNAVTDPAFNGGETAERETVERQLRRKVARATAISAATAPFSSLPSTTHREMMEPLPAAAFSPSAAAAAPQRAAASAPPTGTHRDSPVPRARSPAPGSAPATPLVGTTAPSAARVPAPAPYGDLSAASALLPASPRSAPSSPDQAARSPVPPAASAPSAAAPAAAAAAAAPPQPATAPSASQLATRPRAPLPASVTEAPQHAAAVMRKILAGPRDRATLVAPAGPAVDPPVSDPAAAPCLQRASEPMMGSPTPGSPARSVSSDASSDVSLGLSVDGSSASASPHADESPSSVLQFPSDSEERKQFVELGPAFEPKIVASAYSGITPEVMDEIASFPELSAELVREIGQSIGFRMGQALSVFKRSKSADKKAAADRVHEWMLDQLALTEFSTSDQLTLLVFVDQVMARPFRLESEERAMGKTNMREFFNGKAGERKQFWPTAKELPTELNAISALSMLGVHLRVVHAVTSLREDVHHRLVVLVQVDGPATKTVAQSHEVSMHRNQLEERDVMLLFLRGPKPMGNEFAIQHPPLHSSQRRQELLIAHPAC